MFVFLFANVQSLSVSVGFFTKVLTALVSFAICLEGGSNLILKDNHAMVDILIPCEKGGRWPFPINANHFRITKY